MKRPLMIVPELVVALLFPVALAGPAAAQSAATCDPAANGSSRVAGCDPTVNQASARAARGPEPKETFVAALRQFMQAIAGSYGDERSKIRSSIESMHKALVEWDEAIRQYETEVASQLRGADVHVALGIVYLDRSRVEDALREFDAANRLDASRADVRTLQGLAYTLANMPAQATQAYLKAAELDPGDPTTFYRLARQLTKIGESEEAGKARHSFQEFEQKRLAQPGRDQAISSPFIRVDLLRQAAGVAAIFPPALYARGFTFLKQGRYEQALVRFREAAALDPLRANVVAKTDKRVQGSAALRQGKLQSALTDLRVAVQLAPNDAEAHRILGMAYRADERYDKSIEQLKAAVRLRPRDERSRMALADVLVAAGQFKEAEQALRETTRAVPGSGQAHYSLGRLYQSQLQHAEALHEFEEALKFNPVVGLDHVYQSMISTYYLQPNLDGAIDAYVKRIDANPNNAEAHKELGDAYLQQDRPDEALVEFLATLLINPNNSEAYAGIGQVHMRTGRYADAATASRHALELDPTHKAARYALATSLIRLGQTEEGTKELQEFQRIQVETLAREQRELELKMIKQEASASLDKGEYDKVVALLQQAIPYESHLALP